MPENHRWFRNAYVKIILSKTESAAGISIIEHMMPEGYGPPLHVHSQEDETLYVLEGSIRCRAGEQTVERQAGQSLHVPRGTVHTFRVISPTARFLTVTNGGFEGMVMAASVPADHTGLPEPVAFTPEDQKQLALLCQQAGIEFLGPPID